MWPKLPSLAPPELHWMMLCYVGGQSHIFKSNKLTRLRTLGTQHNLFRGNILICCPTYRDANL